MQNRINGVLSLLDSNTRNWPNKGPQIYVLIDEVEIPDSPCSLLFMCVYVCVSVFVCWKHANCLHENSIMFAQPKGGCKSVRRCSSSRLDNKPKQCIISGFGPDYTHAHTHTHEHMHVWAMKTSCNISQQQLANNNEQEKQEQSALLTPPAAHDTFNSIIIAVIIIIKGLKSFNSSKTHSKKKQAHTHTQTHGYTHTHTDSAGSGL